jgi:hypothetical protein
MEIAIKTNSASTGPSGRSYRNFELVVDGVTVSVMIGDGGALGHSVSVLVVNASHRAFRGLGRTFPSLTAAREAYKGKHARAALAAVSDLVTEVAS